MGELNYLNVAVLVFAAGAVAAGLAWLTRRLVHLEVLRRHHEIGTAVFLQLGVLFAVLLAFVFSEVWSEYNSAASAIDQECGNLNGVSMLSVALPPASRKEMKAELSAYINDVITREFATMRLRQADQDTDYTFQALWLTAATLPGANGQEQGIRNNILSLLTNAHQNRDIRLSQMRRGVPGLVWILLLGFAALLVTFLLFFGVEYIVSQMIFTGTFAATLVFILLIVQALDFPFEGVLRLSSTSFQQTAAKIAAVPGS